MKFRYHWIYAHRVEKHVVQRSVIIFDDKTGRSFERLDYTGDEARDLVRWLNDRDAKRYVRVTSTHDM